MLRPIDYGVFLEEVRQDARKHYECRRGGPSKPRASVHANVFRGLDGEGASAQSLKGDRVVRALHKTLVCYAEAHVSTSVTHHFHYAGLTGV